MEIKHTSEESLICRTYTQTHMDCKQTCANLQLFLDEELDADCMAQMTQHVANCTECSARYNNEVYFKQFVREGLGRFVAAHAAPEDVRLQVLSGVR